MTLQFWSHVTSSALSLEISSQLMHDCLKLGEKAGRDSEARKDWEDQHLGTDRPTLKRDLLKVSSVAVYNNYKRIYHASIKRVTCYNCTSCSVDKIIKKIVNVPENGAKKHLCGDNIQARKNCWSG